MENKGKEGKTINQLRCNYGAQQLWSYKSSWIYSVSSHGHDHVYHTWIHNVLFGIHALFPLLSIDMPTSGIIIYGPSLVVCRFSLLGSMALPCTPPFWYIVIFFWHHLHFWPHDLGDIYYTLIYHPYRLGKDPQHIKALELPFYQYLCTFRELSLLSSLEGRDTFPIAPCTTRGEMISLLAPFTRSDNHVASRDLFWKDEFWGYQII